MDPVNQAEREYREGQGDDQLLREEMARIRRDGRPLEFDIDRQEPNWLSVSIVGLGTFNLRIEQARQLGSALLAEVEIATRGDIT